MCLNLGISDLVSGGKNKHVVLVLANLLISLFACTWPVLAKSAVWCPTVTQTSGSVRNGSLGCDISKNPRD